MDRFYRLLSYGYFPKEVPPIFYSGQFAKEVKRNYASLPGIINKKKMVKTIYVPSSTKECYVVSLVG